MRAYRDVPYVTASVSTDTEAKASRIAATPGYQILDQCIAEVEEAKAFLYREQARKLKLENDAAEQ